MDKQARYSQLLEDLSSEYRPQREWAEGRGFFLIVGHFVVGVAGGTWLFGLFFSNTDAMILSFVLACIGGLAHLGNLARPERAFKMMSQFRTSWVARGFWGLTFFLIGGFLVLVPVLLPGSFWASDGIIGTIGLWLSIIGVVILIGYMGFVYTASKSIPFWNSPLHPVLYMSYAFRGGAAALLLVLAARGQPLDPGMNLLQIWIGITATVIVLWILELQAALTSGDETAKKSVHELLAGRLAIYFYGGTLLIGLLVPVLLVTSYIDSLPSSIMALIGLASVIGDFFIKFSSIKAGIHLPVRLPHIHQRA